MVNEERETFERMGTQEELIEVDAEEIRNAIADKKSIQVGYAVIKGDLDISRIEDRLEKDKDGKSVIQGEIRIGSSKIKGIVNFKDATFIEYVEFSNTTFSVYANFTYTTFSNANFIKATFSGDADFSNANFGKADFSNANFSKADFINTTFINACFCIATFSGDADFHNVTFSGNADFRCATFSKDDNILFRYTTFSGNADFLEVTFNGNTDFTLVKFMGTVNFEKAKLKKVNFDGAQLAIEPNFDETELTPKGFDNIGDLYRRSGLLGGSYYFEQAGEGYLNENNYSDASQSFRNAKIEYNKEGKYDNEGKMYVKEKDCTRLNLKTQKENRLTYTWLTLWKYSSNYGENPFQLFGWIASIVLFFAFIYMPIVPDWWPSQLSITFKEYPYHQWSDGFFAVAYNIITALYFSTVTFATLGFGDIAPVSIIGKIYCSVSFLFLLNYGSSFLLPK